MIENMALRCSSLPLFNAPSDLLTDPVCSCYTHIIKCTAINPFLSFLCAGTGNLVSEFIQRTAHTFLPFTRPEAMPLACRPRTSTLDTPKCPFPDGMRMIIWRGNIKHHLRIHYQGQPPLPASHRRSHQPHQRLYSCHRQSSTETPEPDGSILAHVFDDIPKESESKDDGLYRHVPPPNTLAQESDLGGADPGATLMDKENPEIKVYPTAASTFSDDPEDNEFRALINNLWLPFHCTEYFKQAITSFKAHYPQSRYDRHFNEGRCKILKHFSSASRWTMYNQLSTMDNLWLQLKELSIFTPHGRRCFYFLAPVECTWYLLSRHAYIDHMVYGPSWTFEVEGDCVYSEMNSADWWLETQNRLPLWATIVSLICGFDETQLSDSSGQKKAWPIYLTIGNIHSLIQNKYTYLTQIVLAFLQEPPKYQRNSASGIRAQSDSNQHVMCDIANIVMQLVAWLPVRGDINSGALWPFSNGIIRRCWAILASLLADHMEHANHIGIKYNACPKCQTPKDELGSHILQSKLESPWRKPVVFQQKYRKYRNARTAGDREATTMTEDWFWSVSVRPAMCII